MIDPRRRHEFPRVISTNSRRTRVQHRVSINIRVRIALPKPLAVIVSVRTSDLSIGGISLVLPERLSPGTPIMVGLPLPGHEECEWLQARMRHRNGFRHGFQFIATTLQQRAALRLLCSAER